MTSMCLATFDQFISMTTYRQRNRLRLAHRLIAFACIFWFVSSIFTFIYYDSKLNVCIIINSVYAEYYTYFYAPVLFRYLPLITMIIFSLLAFFKIRTIASRQINIVRLSRDRQLTTMILLHVLFLVILSTPFFIFFVYTLSINSKDSVDVVHNQLICTITVVFCYIGHSVSFFLQDNKSNSFFNLFSVHSIFIRVYQSVCVNKSYMS